MNIHKLAIEIQSGAKSEVEVRATLKPADKAALTKMMMKRDQKLADEAAQQAEQQAAFDRLTKEEQAVELSRLVER